MTPIVPIPAIDIRDGRCVRLIKGDFAKEKIYGEDPSDMARHWEAQGAERLHIVDLDGARDGERANAETVQRAIRAVRIPVQVGGGVRSIEVARQVIEQGADRVIVGTAAAEYPESLGEWLDALGSERVIVGVDAREGWVATRGWAETTQLQASKFCKVLRGVGVVRVLFTDIDRDGTLGGPNLERTRHLAGIIRVIASGGVSSQEHLRQLNATGAEAAVIGTALYDGRLSLKDALAAC